jgi:restriction system protein
MVVVQCKQWRSTKVGVNIVREVYGVMTAKKADSSIVITSGFFTQDAKSFAADKPIDLVDGTQLLRLIGNVQKERVIPATATSSGLCTKCGAEMVLRTAQRGPHLGEKFWGCSNFPRCRLTRPYKA